MNNYDVSMGTGFVRFVPGGGIAGNVFLNGNVGIRKTNPTAALDVSGVMKTNLIDTQNYDISMGTGLIRMSGGVTFTSGNSIDFGWISRASPANYGFYGITYGAGLFVAVGYNGSNNSVATSPDGINWTLRTTPGSGWRSVVYGNGVFVAVGDNGTSRIMTSTDGISWTSINQFTTSGYLYVAYGLVNGTTPTFVAVGHIGANRIIYSTNNGASWTGIATYDAFTWYSCAFGNGNFVALSSDATYALYSSNATTWTQTTAFQVGHDWNAVTYANGLFVAVSGGSGGSGTGGQNLTSRVATSLDGITWTNRYSPDTIKLTGVVYGDGIFVVLGNSGTGYRTITSTDGINWVLRPSANDSIGWRQVCYGNGIFVAVAIDGSYNNIMTLASKYVLRFNKITTDEIATNLISFGQNGVTISSNTYTDVLTWTGRSVANIFGNTLNWNSVCYGNGLFLAVSNYASSGSNQYQAIVSTDGYSWTAPASMTGSLPTTVSCVCYGELRTSNVYVVVGSTSIRYSINGGTGWSSASSISGTTLRSVCFGYDASGNGIFVTVGTNGIIAKSSPTNIANWTSTTVNTLSWYGVCYGYDSSGQGQFVAVSNDGTGSRSMYSIDGAVTWVQVNTTDNISSWRSVCYGNGMFVAVASSGAAGKRVMYSRNIMVAGWSQATYSVDTNWISVCYGNGLFVATSLNNEVMTSPDGINWTIGITPPLGSYTNSWNSVCYGNGTFVSVSLGSSSNPIRVMTAEYSGLNDGIIVNGQISTSGFTPGLYFNQTISNGTAKIFLDKSNTLNVNVNGFDKMYIRPDFGAVTNDFTGQHRAFIKDIPFSQINPYIGLIVVANQNKYISMQNIPQTGINAITINDSLPVCSLCKKEKDKSCYGIISSAEDENERETDLGNGVVIPIQKEVGDIRIFINSVGEGAIWVSNINGKLESGDYITSSSIPGYTMSQDDDLLHNYTVAKITMDCDFNPLYQPSQTILKDANGNNILDGNGEIQWTDKLDGSGNIVYEYAYEIRYILPDGTIITKEEYDVKTTNNETVYIAAFVGCTYHCG